MLIPHYAYNLRERKLAFPKSSSVPGNTPGLPRISSHVILTTPDSHLARWATRQTSLISTSTHTDSSALQSKFAMLVSMASAIQRGLGVEAIVLATSYPK